MAAPFCLSLLIALIGATGHLLPAVQQVACVQLGSILNDAPGSGGGGDGGSGDGVGGALFAKLNNAEMSLDKIESILEAVVDKRATRIGRDSVADILKFKNTATSQCTTEVFQSRNIHTYSSRVNNNAGIMKFASNYFTKLIDNCVDQLDRVLANAVARVSSDDRLILELYGKMIPKYTEPAVGAKEAERELLRLTNKGRAQSARKELEAACKSLNQALLLIRYISAWTEITIAQQYALVGDWAQIDTTCTHYLSRFSPSANTMRTIQ